MAMVATIGRDMGRMIFRKMHMVPAPSIMALSSTEIGSCST